MYFINSSNKILWLDGSARRKRTFFCDNVRHFIPISFIRCDAFLLQDTKNLFWICCSSQFIYALADVSVSEIELGEFAINIESFFIVALLFVSAGKIIP